MSAAKWIATFGGVGLIPVAPGTWGALAALPLGWALHWLGGFWLMAPVTLALFGLGWWAAWAYAAPGTDPGEVVIDEVVGQLVALWPLSLGIGIMAARSPEVSATAFPWPGWVGAFLVFRLFDIWKPPPVSWADAMPGATGIMLDDVVAGIMAAIVVMIAAWIAHAL